jgi:hypothetical protein
LLEAPLTAAPQTRAAPPSALHATLAGLAQPAAEPALLAQPAPTADFAAAEKAWPAASGAAVAFLAALHAQPDQSIAQPDAPGLASVGLRAPDLLDDPSPLELPEFAVAALEAVRPEVGPVLTREDEEPAPLLAQAPLEAARPEDPVEAGVLTLAELESHAGGTGVTMGVLTNQILTGVSTGNAINAGQVSSGGITIETDAFSGYDGIGNFMINSGHNNVLQSSVNVTIVMTPP